VIGSPASSSLLGALAPVLGVNTLTQAAVAQALKLGDKEIEGRRAMVIEQRRRLQEELRELPVETPESQANFVWLRATAIDGSELVRRLDQSRVRSGTTTTSAWRSATAPPPTGCFGRFGRRSTSRRTARAHRSRSCPRKTSSS
jgi:histidinol-phosphate aminotransferase